MATLFTDAEDSDGNPSTSGLLPKTKPNHIVHKLTFYAAHILGTPGPMLRVLADEATMRAKTLENEARQAGQKSSEGEVKRVGGGTTSTPRIEEM